MARVDDIVNAMATEAGISRAKAGVALNALIREVVGALNKGEKVTIRGFGTFSVSGREARTGRNPATGTPMAIPARRVPKFTPGKGLREAVG